MRTAFLHGAGIAIANGLVTLGFFWLKMAKVALAKEEASGIMIWELSQDALGADSLLKVIWEASQ